MFKFISYISIAILLIAYINPTFARGGHGHGHGHGHGNSHSYGHRNVKIRNFVGTAAIVDLYIFHKFQNSLEYSISDNNIYNISYIRSFNDSIKNYTCIYYTQTNDTNIINNTNDIIMIINLKQYPEHENLHKYCTYKYLKSYRDEQNNLFIILLLIFVVGYFCIESCSYNRINAY